MESTDDDWHAAIETNLHGFFNCCRVVLPHMMERRSGRIIATGSIIVDTGNFGHNKYAVCTASKGGIVAMVKPLAVRLRPMVSPSMRSPRLYRDRHDARD